MRWVLHDHYTRDLLLYGCFLLTSLPQAAYGGQAGVRASERCGWVEFNVVAKAGVFSNTVQQNTFLADFDNTFVGNDIDGRSARNLSDVDGEKRNFRKMPPRFRAFVCILFA